MSATLEPGRDIPDEVARLQKFYGPPSQSGFGSAVFYDRGECPPPEVTLEQASLARYQYFVGEIWERYGEENWLNAWRPIYVREVGVKPDIVSELRSIRDSAAHTSVSLLLDDNDNRIQAQAALVSVFDDDQIVELRVFTLGDGQAMSGILIAARRSRQDSIFLVLLMD